MNVGAVSAVSGGVGPVYAALSPYLNGVQRLSDAEAAVQLEASATADRAAANAAAIAARAATTSSEPAAPPFLNPAIADIAARTTVTSPTDAVLYGDSGLLVQSYGAVALLTAPQSIAAAYGLPAAPAVPAVPPVTAYPRVARVTGGTGGAV